MEVTVNEGKNAWEKVHVVFTQLPSVIEIAWFVHTP